MGKRSKKWQKGSRSGLYLLIACVLVVGALGFGWRTLGSSTPQVEEVSPPEVAKAPEPAKSENPEKAPSKDSAQKESQGEQAQSEDAQSEQAQSEDEQQAEAQREQAQREEAQQAEAQRKQEQQQAEAQQQTEQAALAPTAPAPTAPAQTTPASTAPAPSSTDMYLTVPAMGIQGDYVANGIDEATLYNGAGHAPQSGFPWQPGSNTYIASHVLGYSGTGSYLDFAQLPNMAYGDQIFLTNANGTQYTYTVSEILQVGIDQTWVINPTGEDIVSLQTCINPPAYDVRLVVRGTLTDVQPA